MIPKLMVEATGDDEPKHLADVRNLHRLGDLYARCVTLVPVVAPTVNAIRAGERCNQNRPLVWEVAIKTSPLLCANGQVNGYCLCDRWAELGAVLAEALQDIEVPYRIFLENESARKHALDAGRMSMAGCYEALREQIPEKVQKWLGFQWYPIEPDCALDQTLVEDLNKPILQPAPYHRLVDSASWRGPTEIGLANVLGRRRALAAMGKPVVSMAYVYSLHSGGPELSPPTWGIDDLPWVAQVLGTKDGFVYVTRKLLMAALQRLGAYGYRIVQAIELEEA